jgi:hypothetical protein
MCLSTTAFLGVFTMILGVVFEGIVMTCPICNPSFQEWISSLTLQQKLHILFESVKFLLQSLREIATSRLFYSVYLDFSFLIYLGSIKCVWPNRFVRLGLVGKYRRVTLYLVLFNCFSLLYSMRYGFSCEKQLR